MFSTYSDIELMQLEIQWWTEQRTHAVKDDDLRYVWECNEAIDSLTEAVMLLKDGNES